MSYYYKLIYVVTVITQPASTTACVGGTAVFTCVMDIPNVNISILDITWWRIRNSDAHWIRIISKAVRRLNVNNSINQGTLTSAFMITDVRSIDVGPYLFILMIPNKFAMGSNMAFLNIVTSGMYVNTCMHAYNIYVHMYAS